MNKLLSSLILICCMVCETCAEEAFSIGVIYPELRAPYDSLFESMLSGLKSNKPLSAKVLQIGSSIDNKRVSEWAIKNNFNSIVLLGKQGVSVSTLLPDSAKVVIGAVLLPPTINEGIRYDSGILLAPAPERLFEWLGRLSPGVKKVSVVFNPSMNGWLVEYAKKAAIEQGLTLNAIPAKDLRDSVQIYKVLIEDTLGPEHALWLPQDPHTVDQQTTLPLLLKEAWDRDFVVFSSNPSDVKRGALFGLYPDNEAMGRSLGRLALELANNKDVKKLPIEPLNDVLIAVNLRTADHLQLNFSKNLLDSFNLTFPAAR